MSCEAKQVKGVTAADYFSRSHKRFTLWASGITDSQTKLKNGIPVLQHNIKYHNKGHCFPKNNPIGCLCKEAMEMLRQVRNFHSCDWASSLNLVSSSPSYING